MFHRTQRSRSLLRVVTCALAAAAASLCAVAPAHAEPTPQAVEKQIEQAWNKLEPIIEQYNRTHGQLQDNRTQQKKLAVQLKPLQTRVDAALANVGALASRAYMQGGHSALASMLVTGSSADLTDKLTYLDFMARSERIQVSDVIALRDKYAADKKDLDTLTATLAARDADLSAKKKDIEKKIDGLQKLRIKAYGAGGGSSGKLRTGPCPAAYTNDAGGRAAAKACSLIGKPYIWAAAGPTGYDCSGLTLVAWRSAGVSLRHYTKWQWADATPIDRADLKPGDLVFWFSDLHHMGMYVGDNTVVHAPHTGDFVRMAGINDIGPIAGYRRPS
ncbi:NlpC/P60 family protein [Couchioplanes caeruleus]|uniref:C40 family peptidase n=1 Tax=Couchioplanes caeruleus TaxID=56438 RepID=UPI0020BEF60A|nr:NlpC/P60 family protein [Couchioplanes caeruleus]UQU67481.1 NlpC/P60 family protein [Couchioplanes caeruleus]